MAPCVCGMELFSYVDRFTVTDLLTGFPSGAVQEIVNVVVFVSATVEALPEGAVWEKAPSGDVIVQSFTPCEVQNTDAREPKGTEAGTAQISTFGGKTGAVVVALDVAIFCTILTLGAAAGAVPTE
mgnify:CR=1 FL=1